MVAFLLYLSIQTALMWKCGNKKDSTEKMYPNLLLRGFKLLRAECIKDWHHPGFIDLSGCLCRQQWVGSTQYHYNLKAGKILYQCSFSSLINNKAKNKNKKLV